MNYNYKEFIQVLFNTVNIFQNTNKTTASNQLNSKKGIRYFL